MSATAPRRRSRILVIAVIAAFVLLVPAGWLLIGGDDSQAPIAEPGTTELDDRSGQPLDVPAEPGAAVGDPADGAVPESAPLDDGIIVTASQEVVVADVASAARRMTAQIAAAQGVVVQERTSSARACPEEWLAPDTAYGCPPGAMSTITYRAPVAAVDALLEGAAGLGDESWRTRSATDVRDQIADVDSRVSSARASLDRLNALLARAETLSEIIAIESQIASRQSDLESLLARQKSLADSTATATVTTTFVTTAAVPDEEPSGFLDGLRSGWDALVSAATVGATLIGWALPFLAVGLLAAIPAVRILRRRRGAQRSERAAAQEPAQSAPEGR